MHPTNPMQVSTSDVREKGVATTENKKQPVSEERNNENDG